MSIKTKLLVGCICLCLMVTFISGNAYAKRARTEKNTIETKEFRIDELYISQTNIPADQILYKLANRAVWNSFLLSNSDSSTYFDPRTGRPTSITAVFPLIPGSGNSNTITLESLSRSLGWKVETVGEKEVQTIAQKFLNEHAQLLTINVKEIGTMRAVQVADFLWQIYIPRQINGIPVRDANIVMSINHGNLVMWGIEKWGDVSINVIPTITKEQAVQTGMAHIGGQLPIDTFTSEPRLELVPVSSPKGGIIGEGIDHRLVWVFSFTREGYSNHWEMLVDAHRNQIIEMRDLNVYVTKKIVGSTYPKTNDDCCPEGCPEYGAPISHTNTGLAAPNNYTDISGLFDWTSGTVTTTLVGRYVRITERCGAISESSTTGDIDMLGTYNQHDCNIPAGHSAGDTFSGRTCAAEVAQTNRAVRSWVAYTWLDNQQVTCITDVNNTCNATYGGNTMNMYRSGGGCRNTGEETASITHEWAHGLDDNDVNGNFSNPEEVYADLNSVLKLHNDCPDRGWWTGNMGCGTATCPTNPSSVGGICDGYGDCCTTCTGLRESDWAKHVSNTPHTPANFNCVRCSSGTGPCGKETHCENAPGAEAGWDLAARDLQASPFNLNRQTAFMFAYKLYVQGSGNVTTWHSCNCSTGASDGCATQAGYKQWVTADDDDGNITNGTPHMTAIYAAFNRHAIACATPTPVNSGCATGPTQAPILTGTPGNNSVSLSWTTVPNAATYNIFKGTGTWACDMEKVKLANQAGTTYIDTSPNGYSASYSVQAVGTNTNCLGPMSTCVTVTPVATSPLPGKVLNTLLLNKSGTTIVLNWAAVLGTCSPTGYGVYRGTLPWTAYNHASLSCAVTGITYSDSSAANSYYYLVVPLNATSEGSYGLASSGSQIPQGSSPCRTQNLSLCN